MPNAPHNPDGWHLLGLQNQEDFSQGWWPSAFSGSRTSPMRSWLCSPKCITAQDWLGRFNSSGADPPSSVSDPPLPPQPWLDSLLLCVPWFTRMLGPHSGHLCQDHPALLCAFEPLGAQRTGKRPPNRSHF